MNPTLLRIALLGMSPRNTSTFHYFIKKHASHIFYVAPSEQSDACIVDFDAPSGKAQWQLYGFDHKPCIILAEDNPQLAQSVWVKKPINAAAMKAAIEKLHSLAQSPEKIEADDASASCDISEKAAPAQHVEVDKSKAAVGYQHSFSEAHSPSLTLSKRSIVECCGSQADGDLATDAWQKQMTYNPSNSLLYAINQAVKVAQEKNVPVELQGLRTSFVVMPGGESIYVDLDSHLIRHICAMAIQQSPTIKPLQMSLLECNQRYRETDRNMHHRNTVLWQVALWSSRGRLPKTVSAHTSMRLVAWPNFTRLTITPFAIAMASFWVNNTQTPAAIAKQMDIPQRYVFAFVAALDAVGLIQLQAIEPKTTTQWRSPKGLLHSILRSLKAA